MANRKEWGAALMGIGETLKAAGEIRDKDREEAAKLARQKSLDNFEQQRIDIQRENQALMTEVQRGQLAIQEMLAPLQAEQMGAETDATRAGIDQGWKKLEIEEDRLKTDKDYKDKLTEEIDNRIAATNKRLNIEAENSRIGNMVAQKNADTAERRVLNEEARLKFQREYQEAQRIAQENDLDFRVSEQEWTTSNEIIKDVLGGGGLPPVARDIVDAVISDPYATFAEKMERLSDPETLAQITKAGVPEGEAQNVIAAINGVLTNHLFWTGDENADPAMVLGRYPILRYNMATEGQTVGGFATPATQQPAAGAGGLRRQRTQPYSEINIPATTPWNDGTPAQTTTSPDDTLGVMQSGDPILDSLNQVIGEGN